MNDSSSINRSRYTQNPHLAKAAFETVRKDSNFLEAADKALKDVLATKAGEVSSKSKVSENELKAITLTPPTRDAKEQLNTEGKLTLLLGQLMTLMGDVSLSQLEARLATWRAMSESRKSMGEQISNEFKEALKEAEEATETYKEKLDTFKSLKAAHDAALKKLAIAETKLSSLSPEDPGYAQAKAAVAQASKDAEQKEKEQKGAKEASLKAHDVAKDKSESADKLISKAQGLSVSPGLVAQHEKDNLTNVAKMTMLMAMFIELVGKNTEESFKNDMALFQALQEGRQKEMDKKSTEFQEETRKAEELNRVMGCVGKIVGALLTIVSVVAAAFTGGASLALAAVGLALMVADEIVKAATGVSFIQQALSPLMEHVLKPLMELIGNAITKALESFGVDKKTAEMVGSIAGALVAAIAMVAVIVIVAVVGKGAAAKLGNALSKLLGDTIKKIVPNVLKEFAKNGGKLLSQGMQRLTNNLGHVGGKMGLQTNNLSKEILANTLNKGVMSMEAVHIATQSAGGVAAGVFMKNASDAMADFSLARFSMEQIQQWLKQAVETFGESHNITQELHKVMSASMQQNSEATRFVLRQSRA